MGSLHILALIFFVAIATIRYRSLVIQFAQLLTEGLFDAAMPEHANLGVVVESGAVAGALQILQCTVGLLNILEQTIRLRLISIRSNGTGTAPTPQGGIVASSPMA